MEGPSKAETQQYFKTELRSKGELIRGTELSMTKDEFITELTADTLLGKTRRVFSSESGHIEQALQQRDPPSSVELRMMEFDAVVKIADALGVSLTKRKP